MPRQVGRLPGFVEPATGASLSNDGRLLAVCAATVTRIYQRDALGGWAPLASVRYDSLPVEGVAWDGMDLILVSEGRGVDRMTQAAWKRHTTTPAPRRSAPGDSR